MTVALALAWTSDEVLEIDGIRFHLVINPDEYTAEDSSTGAFVLVKPREMVDQMIELVNDLKPDRIVEVGIFKGGSAALLATLRPQARITAVDIASEPVAALDEFIACRGLGDRVWPHYGVDQGDAEQLAGIIDRDHGTAPLDYVVDDASHLYPQTKTTFEVLFPRLRPGGVFVIEDWAWAHYPEALWQASGGWFHDRPALTNLAVELLLVAGTSADLVSNIRVSHNYVEVVRGDAAYSPRIRLEDHYRNRGLPFRPLI
jgi:predicted O-methyltransferase YrrM